MPRGTARRGQRVLPARGCLFSAQAQTGSAVALPHVKFDSKSDIYIREILTMVRRFEFIGGNSARFWSITVSGSHVDVRCGRLGTYGQLSAKPFPDAVAAQKHADKLIASKLGKGYRETTAV